MLIKLPSKGLSDILRQTDAIGVQQAPLGFHSARKMSIGESDAGIATSNAPVRMSGGMRSDEIIPSRIPIQDFGRDWTPVDNIDDLNHDCRRRAVDRAASELKQFEAA